MTSHFTDGYKYVQYSYTSLDKIAVIDGEITIVRNFAKFICVA